MTDRGIKVRWTTAALVAPAAAALFTGTTVWASGHQPATASTPKAAAATPKPTVDPLVLALRTAVDTNTAQVAKLRTTVASLQAQAVAIAKGSTVRVTKTSGGSTTWKSTTKKSSTKSTSKATSKATSKSTSKASAPAPAPASNGSTGASGAK
jgi:starch synthase (maltosyl-transferring)